MQKLVFTCVGLSSLLLWNQGDPRERGPRPRNARKTQQAPRATDDRRNDPATARPRDPAAEAQRTVATPAERPEQQINEHDRSPAFVPNSPAPLTGDFADQPNAGRLAGFDFARDPLNAPKPLTTLEEVRTKESAAREQVMAAHRALLEARYDLTPRFDPNVTMFRGKRLAVGPTAKLRNGMTWSDLQALSPNEIKEQGLFPYPSLPHPLQTNGGQVFPQMQIEMFPRLQRFDVDFDLPEEFLPEFPPAIFLQNRPELGDVSRGQVVSLNNFHELFKGIHPGATGGPPAVANSATARRVQPHR